MHGKSNRRCAFFYTQRLAMANRKKKGEDTIRAYRSTIVLSVLLLVLSCCSLFVGVIDLTPAELLAGNFEQMEVFLISRLPRLLAIVMSWSVRSMIRILFLCHGNICRSPMAEFIMKDLVKKAGLEQSIQIESAATSTEEIGNPVYPPTRRKLSEHGIDCSGKRARQLLNSDYEKYDLLIGMDRANLRSMYRICGGDFADKMHLLMDFTNSPGEVADPWYTDDFDTTWRDVEEGCRGLLQKIISKEVQTSGQAGC